MRFYLIGTIALLLIVSRANAGPMPPHSYLLEPAHTHEALMKHVTTNPVVLDRYMRHFAMSRSEVVQYLNDLELMRIPNDMTFVVYNVPNSGELRSRILKFKKGTKIWVDKSGRPILKEECGNPLTKGPVKPEAMSISTAAESAAPPKETVTEDVPATEVIASMQPAEPEIPAVVAEAVPTPTGPTEPFVTQGLSNIPVAGVPWWLGLPVLGGALAIVPHGDNPNPPPPPPPPVPEPASYLALALGSGALIVSIQRRRKV